MNRVQRNHPNMGQIKYKAKQVLSRDNNTDPFNSLPIGSNMIGRLLTGIDTRDANQFIKVILPYGGVFKNNRILEQNTILLGSIKYSGKGEKVFVKFNKGVLPSGREFKFEGQALNSKDYSTGLVGDYHSQADLRFLTTVGLSMISTGAGVLTEKEALSDAQAPTPKSNMKNAFLQSSSKGAEMEAQRQAADMKNKKEYVTVDAGVDVIVNLTASLSKDSIND